MRVYSYHQWLKGGLILIAFALLFSSCVAKKGAVKEGILESNALILFREGSELLYQDNQEALKKFDNAFGIDEGFIPAYYNAGVACEALGNLAEAEKRYEACLAHKKDQPDCLFNLLLVKAKLGDVEGAEKLAQTYLTEFPDAPFAESAAAGLAFFVKDYHRAEKLAREVLERDAENVEALYIMARIFYEQKKYAAAKWVVKEALVTAPRYGALYLVLGHTASSLGLLHDALDAYALAVKYQPNEESLESYGLLLLKRGRVALALSILERLVKLRPENYRNYLHVGNAYMANKKFPESKAAYLRALDLKPDDRDINFNLGLLYYDQKPEGILEIDRLKTALGYFKAFLDQVGLSKERIKEVNEYLDLIKQKIELEEYKAASEEEMKKAGEENKEPQSQKPPESPNQSQPEKPAPADDADTL